MKKLLLLSFLFFNFFCEAHQYLPYIVWQKNIGTSSQIDEVWDGMETNDGGYLLCASTDAGISEDKTDVARAGGDIWLIKLNSEGIIEWQKTIGGNSYDRINKVIQTADNGYVIGGSSSSELSGDRTIVHDGVGADCWFLKLDKNGNIQWQKVYAGSDNDYMYDFAPTKDGGYIIGARSSSDSSVNKTQNSRGTYDYWVIKVDSVGIMQWQKTLGGSDIDLLSKISQTLDGGYIVAGSSRSDSLGDKTMNNEDLVFSTNDFWVIKLDGSGNIQWQKDIGSGSREDDMLNDMVLTKDSCFILVGASTKNHIVKINSNGNILWKKNINSQYFYNLTSISPTYDNGYIIGGWSFAGIGGDKTEASRGVEDYWIIKFDSAWNIQWDKTIGGSREDNLRKIIQLRDKDYLLIGNSKSNISGEKTSNIYSIGDDLWIIKLRVASGASLIKGSVFKQSNTDCIQDYNEKGIPNVIVKTEPYSIFNITNEQGSYSLLVDTGIYKIKQIIPAVLKPFLQQTVCPTQSYHTVLFSQYGQDTSEINFANYERQCAYLQVELAQSRMRRCFDNGATIKYCNIGNVDTTNVQVVIQLPEYITFVSASNPNYTINGKKITFNIGNLRANECGTINLVTKVDCVEGITGLTQCMSAYILPRNKCVDQIQSDYALWDKSEVNVEGRCTGNTARFVIKNIGQNNMTDSSIYRIYKDAVQALNKKFKLTAGDSLVLNVTATGHTYRLEADQTAHYPSASQPSVTIENCGTGVASRGFVNQQAQDKADVAAEKICLEIRDSYDPNDKQVFPSGVGVDKKVPHKVPLDFLIRFQNTGTDTAYKVVITDTLNQNLDLATLEFGASSHPYKVEFTGSGRPILKFTFDKINLVDSFTNEPKSHGFVSFKVTPYDSIPNGTLVKNNADIYFDFNLPIKTNTTQVSIDDRLPTGATLNLVTSVKQNNTIYEAIHVYPNPFTQTTNFEFVYNTKANQLIVYDVNGELVVQENIAGKTTFQLQRTNLPNGMYFYNIQNKDGEIIGRGKLVLQ